MGFKEEMMSWKGLSTALTSTAQLRQAVIYLGKFCCQHPSLELWDFMYA